MSKLLRARYAAFKDRFGTAGVVIGVIALIAALGGTALAAGSLTSKQKKEVAKIAKKYAGKPGAPGATGPAGTNGTNGKDGTNGTNGESVTISAASAGECSTGGSKFSNGAGSGHVCNGAAGSPGTSGNDGKSVESFAIAPGAGDTHCNEQGGSEFEVEGSGSPTYACNGKEGSPWTMNGTLPPGATETGAYAVQGSQAGSGFGLVASISFPIKLASNTGYGLHYSTQAGFSTPCPGSAEDPTAEPGQLCVYAAEEWKTSFVGVYKVPAVSFGINKSGAFLEFAKDTSTTETAYASGSFAIRAPAAP